MRYNIEGFDQATLAKWHLDAKDALILRWFIDFKSSGRMNTVDGPHGNYFWVNYQAVIDDLPVLEIRSRKAIANRFGKMVKAGLLMFYLKKDGAGTYSTYQLVQSRYNELLPRIPERTKMPTGIESSSIPLPRKQLPKDSSINTIQLINDDEAIIKMEPKKQKEPTKCQEELVPPASIDPDYSAAVNALVEAYNRAAIKASYPEASRKNIATFYTNVTLSYRMLPTFLKHMDLWFSWEGRTGHVEDLGDKSISIFAFNQKAFYDYVVSLPTDEQLLDIKRRDLILSLAGDTKDTISMYMRSRPDIKWTPETYLYLNDEYEVDLEHERLLFPNGTIITREDYGKYITTIDESNDREEKTNSKLADALRIGRSYF